MMSSLLAYLDDDEDEQKEIPQNPQELYTLPFVTAAASDVTTLLVPPKTSQPDGPLRGPVPVSTLCSLDAAMAARAQGLSGQVEVVHLNPLAFEVQRRNFQAYGSAADPSDDAHGQEARCSSDSIAKRPYYVAKEMAVANKRAKARRSHRPKEDPASDDFQGPWSKGDGEQTIPPSMEEQELLAGATELVAAVTAANELEGAEEEEGPGKEGEEGPGKETAEGETADKGESAGPSILPRKLHITTTFHGEAEIDYQGRSWLAQPTTMKRRDDDDLNFAPSKCVWTYSGHKGAVHAVRFIPDSGHMLLSCSADHKIKIWDNYNSKRCMRTYVGHNESVKDICFADLMGQKFYSCGFDQRVLLWDTETGKVDCAIDNGSTPFCIAVHPQQPWSVMVGARNKKIAQYDARSGNMIQEYWEHLGSVNSVTFIQNGDKLITTADDKKMLVWEYGIPVVVKHIADPAMHSMPAVKLSPDGKNIACQSMDNQIRVWDVADRVHQRHNKRFRGHHCAGYAILPAFSADNKWLAAGDASGKLFLWDWKTGRNYRTLDAHKKVVINSEWHPHMPSRIATCAWDGLIKLWE